MCKILIINKINDKSRKYNNDYKKTKKHFTKSNTSKDQ